MVTQTSLTRLNIYLPPTECALFQVQARACQLSVSGWMRAAANAQLGQIDRIQRIDQACSQLVRTLAALQLEPDPQSSSLFADSIALVQSIQQEVRGA